MKQKMKSSIPAEVTGEFVSLFTALSIEESRFLRDLRPFTISEADMDGAARDMERDARKEHDLHLYNLECAASAWKRKVEFGKWVAHKPENRAYFTHNHEEAGATYTGAFSALKGRK